MARRTSVGDEAGSVGASAQGLAQVGLARAPVAGLHLEADGDHGGGCDETCQYGKWRTLGGVHWRTVLCHLGDAGFTDVVDEFIASNGFGSRDVHEDVGFMSRGSTGL